MCVLHTSVPQSSNEHPLCTKHQPSMANLAWRPSEFRALAPRGPGMGGWHWRAPDLGWEVGAWTVVPALMVGYVTLGKALLLSGPRGPHLVVEGLVGLPSPSFFCRGVGEASSPEPGRWARRRLWVSS